MELLLRHAVQYLGLRGKKMVSTKGVLDDVQGFTEWKLPQELLDDNEPDEPITRDEQAVVKTYPPTSLSSDSAQPAAR